MKAADNAPDGIIKPPVLIPPEECVRFVGAPHPFKTDLVNEVFPEGTTLLEMLKAVQPDPLLLGDAAVFIDGNEIKREYWHLVRPKAGTLINARVFILPRGGGGKDPLRTVLSLAVVVATFAFAAPLGGALLGANAAAVGTGIGFAAGGVSTLVGASIIGVGGLLLTNAIAPIRPPRLGALSGQSNSSRSLFLDGSRNDARLFEPVSSVLGFYRFRPALGALPSTEVLGNKNRLKILLAVGFGPLEMSDWRIGDTPIDRFTDYKLETREGYADDAPLTLIPSNSAEIGLSIKMESKSSYTRTAPKASDNLGVDFTLPSGGLAYYSGSIGPVTIILKVEYRLIGAPEWTVVKSNEASITFDDYRGPYSNFYGPAFTSALAGLNRNDYFQLNLQTTESLRHNIRWSVPRGEYEIQFTNVISDQNSGVNLFGATEVPPLRRIVDIYWSGLRAETTSSDGTDISTTTPYPLAKAALDILATDQLSGTLDTLSCLAKSVVPDWDRATQTWIERASNNPASLFRHVCQGPANPRPKPDSKVDLERLQEWHEFCEEKGFGFNMVRDFKSSINDCLRDICAAGRAGLIKRNGKKSVNIDRPKSMFGGVITSRNCMSFSMEKAFVDLPHAFRVRFPDAENDYKQGERIVYLGDYNETTATLFQTLEFPGVTDAGQIFHLTEYSGAVATHRAERWTASMDFESMGLEPGVRVKVQHDVLLAGIGSGRLKTVTADDQGRGIEFEVDEPLKMVSGKDYGLVVRRAADSNVVVSFQIETVAGVSTIAMPVTPVAASALPEEGDLFSYGEFGSETEDGLVLGIAPGDDYAGEVKIVPYRGEFVYATDGGTIPPYTPIISPPEILPPVVIEVVTTNETVLELRDGVVVENLQAAVKPIERTTSYLQIQARQSDSGQIYEFADVVEQGNDFIRIRGVNTGEDVDIRVRWADVIISPGPWTERLNTQIIGFSTPPGPLRDATIEEAGSNKGVIEWARPFELDVIHGGRVEFRFNEAAPEWEGSEFLELNTNPGSGVQTTNHYRVGYYLARVVDSFNLVSAVTVLATIADDGHAYTGELSILESPEYLGDKSNTVAPDGVLQLANDTQPGIYEFKKGFRIPLGDWSFSPVLTAEFTESELLIDDYLLPIDDWLDFDGYFESGPNIDARLRNIDTWESFDFYDRTPHAAHLQIWIRSTSDNPLDYAVWSNWRRLNPGEVYSGQGFIFEARLLTNPAGGNISISRLGVDARRSSG